MKSQVVSFVSQKHFLLLLVMILITLYDLTVLWYKMVMFCICGSERMIQPTTVRCKDVEKVVIVVVLFN